MEQRPRRWARRVGYVGLAAAGLAWLAWPNPSVRGTSGVVLAYIWAACLLAGGAACAAGALFNRWLGEYVGLPLLSTVFAAFSVVVAAAAVAGARWWSVGGALFLFGFAGLLHARWQYVAAIRRDEDARLAGRGR